MQWIEAKIHLPGAAAGQDAELVALLFEEVGITGVVIDDPLLEPPEGWGDDAPARPSHFAVTGYIPLSDRGALLQDRLEKATERFNVRHHTDCRMTSRIIDEQDWAEAWKAYFWPEKISPRLAVKPTWRRYTPGNGEHVIQIDPGMAFGTGTHPTTALCLQLIDKLIMPEASVLDVGTGSGILLIAAALLGAGELVGVDTDPVAVSVARDNLILNQVSDRHFQLHCGVLADLAGRRFDLVVANILADVIIDMADDLAMRVTSGGTLICSGIIASRCPDVLTGLTTAGFRNLAVHHDQEWVAVSGTR